MHGNELRGRDRERERFEEEGRCSARMRQSSWEKAMGYPCLLNRGYNKKYMNFDHRLT